MLFRSGYTTRKKVFPNGRTQRKSRFLLYNSEAETYSRDDIPHATDATRQACVESAESAVVPLYLDEKEVFIQWEDGLLTTDAMRELKTWWEGARTPDRTAYVVDIPKRHGVTVADQDEATVKAALLAFARAHWREVATRTFVFLPLPFIYRRSDEDVGWKFLFGAVNYKYVDEQNRSHFSILKYLYSRSRKGDEIRRSFFPFVNWDSGRKSRFSFFWRLFNYENDNGTTRGHILFIPWGDHD